MLLNDTDRVLVTKEQLAARVKELGQQISRDYAGKTPVIVCTLKGATVFFADLIRSIDIPVTLDFIVASSYGSAAVSGGEIRIRKDLDNGIKGKDVIIVEDIIDTGLTLNKLTELLRTREPASLKICCCLDKPSRRRVDLKADYSGFDIPDEFVVGYGLDYDEKYRNLDAVYVLKREIYE